MAKRILTHLDFQKTSELRNALWHLLNTAPVSPATGQFYYDTALNRFRGYHGATLGWQSLLPESTTLDQIAVAAADVNLNTHKITNLAAGTSQTDAINLSQLQSAVNGLDWKPSVKAATTGNITLSGAQTLDGVALVAGDRALVKNQTTQTENGLYLVASGGWTRVTDADTDAEFTQNLTVWVEQGTTLADTAWTVTTNATISLGTTSIVFAQVSAPLSQQAGAGLVLNGNAFDVTAASGSGIVVTADAVDIDPVNGLPINRGGTGGITVAAAKTNLGFTTRATATIGDGAATSIAVTHSLGTKEVVSQVRQASDDSVVDCDIVNTSTTQTTYSFAVAPASNAIKVVILG